MSRHYPPIARLCRQKAYWWRNEPRQDDRGPRIIPVGSQPEQEIKTGGGVAEPLGHGRQSLLLGCWLGARRRIPIIGLKRTGPPDRSSFATSVDPTDASGSKSSTCFGVADRRGQIPRRYAQNTVGLWDFQDRPDSTEIVERQSCCGKYLPWIDRAWSSQPRRCRNTSVRRLLEKSESKQFTPLGENVRGPQRAIQEVRGSGRRLMTHRRSFALRRLTIPTDGHL